MKRFVFLIGMLSSIFSLSASAVPYFSGQKEYLIHCRSCHGGGIGFVSQYTVEEWSELQENNAKKLYDTHVNVKKTEELNKYLKSPHFQKKLIYFKAFTKRFAKDSDKNHANKKQ